MGFNWRQHLLFSDSPNFRTFFPFHKTSTRGGSRQLSDCELQFFSDLRQLSLSVVWKLENVHHIAKTFRKICASRSAFSLSTKFCYFLLHRSINFLYEPCTFKFILKLLLTFAIFGEVYAFSVFFYFGLELFFIIVIPLFLSKVK